MVGGSDVHVLMRHPRRRRCVLRVLHAADRIIAVAGDLKEKLAQFGVPPAKIQVIYRGVSDAFRPGSRIVARRSLGMPLDGSVLLWVGRMVPVKGLDVLLQASALLRETDQTFQLYLVGDGPCRPALQAQATNLGLSGVVRFVGTVPHKQLPDWYRAANLFVLASHSEGVPNVLLESLACGTPFVATNVGGIPEIDGGCSSELVPPKNPVLLTEAMGRALRRLGQSTNHLGYLRTQAETAQEIVQTIRGLLRTKCESGLPVAVDA
jgi:glycosyltransferase involved in cell wall biosynthesis